jgi:hypothetical protein
MRPLLFALGAFLMTATATPPADGQDKKDEKPREPYTEFVKWESLDKDGKVTHTAERVPAFRPATKAPTWRVQRTAIKADIPKMARITDKNGTVFKIGKIEASPGQLFCIVEEPGNK